MSLRQWITIVQEAVQLAEADFDPTKTDKGAVSFLFIDDKFVAVPYQHHLDALGQYFKVQVPSSNDWGIRADIYDKLNALAAQHGVVQGDYSEARKIGETFYPAHMGLKGTLVACRKAFRAFRAQYPELMKQVDVLGYDIIDETGHRIKEDVIRDSQIDRMFGRRG